MKQYILEGKKIIDEKTFHEMVIATFDIRDAYGLNLDSFNDNFYTAMLMDKHEKVEIIWKDHLTSRKNLGVDLFNNIVSIIKDIRDEYGLTFRLTLK